MYAQKWKVQYGLKMNYKMKAIGFFIGIGLFIMLCSRKGEFALSY